MPNYRRIWTPGGTYFFTVNLADRKGTDLLTRHIQALRHAVWSARRSHPFIIHAWVVLPDHLHCIIELPPNDSNYAIRWRIIKTRFSMALPVGEKRSLSRRRRGERGIWQRRYWARVIVDDADMNTHMDYVHVNPVKHGLVERVVDWPYSTFHHWVDKGVYPESWVG